MEPTLIPSPRPWPSRSECLAAIREGDGAGVIVAVLDTGLDPHHPDLAAMPLAGTWQAIFTNDDTCVIEPAPGNDPAGHGTAIAGIIHAIAPAATILSIGVLGADHRQSRHRAIWRGARFAMDHGARLLNCSFGVPGLAPTLPIYKEWTDEAFHRDCTVVAASSNVSADHVEYPAFFAQVIGVTAGEESRCTMLESRPRHHVTISAPGAGIRVPVPGGGHAQVTGSSFAAAHVTGLLARLLSRYPGLTPSMTREALEHHAASGDPPEAIPA
jgi:subtilisin